MCACSDFAKIILKRTFEQKNSIQKNCHQSSIFYNFLLTLIKAKSANLVLCDIDCLSISEVSVNIVSRVHWLYWCEYPILKKNGNKKNIELKNTKIKWDIVFKKGPSKTFGRQPLKKLSTTNFTWSTLEHFFPNKTFRTLKLKASLHTSAFGSFLLCLAFSPTDFQNKVILQMHRGINDL